MATIADIGLRFLVDEYGEAQAARLLMISNQNLKRWLRRGIPKKHRARIRTVYSVNHARDQIEALLRDAQSCVADKFGHVPYMRVALNSDNTVDGQLTVYDIPRGLTVRAAIIQVNMCASALRNLDNGFVQVGLRWGAVGTDKPPESGDRRHRGLAEASTYWYRAHRWVDMWLYALDMAKRVAAKTRNKKIETIFLRVHWNEQNRTPRR